MYYLILLLFPFVLLGQQSDSLIYQNTYRLLRSGADAGSIENRREFFWSQNGLRQPYKGVFYLNYRGVLSVEKPDTAFVFTKEIGIEETDWALRQEQFNQIRSKKAEIDNERSHKRIGAKLPNYLNLPDCLAWDIALPARIPGLVLYEMDFISESRENKTLGPRPQDTLHRRLLFRADCRFALSGKLWQLSEVKHYAGYGWPNQGLDSEFVWAIQDLAESIKIKHIGKGEYKIGTKAIKLGALCIRTYLLELEGIGKLVELKIKYKGENFSSGIYLNSGSRFSLGNLILELIENENSSSSRLLRISKK